MFGDHRSVLVAEVHRLRIGPVSEVDGAFGHGRPREEHARIDAGARDLHDPAPETLPIQLSHAWVRRHRDQQVDPELLAEGHFLRHQLELVANEVGLDRRAPSDRPTDLAVQRSLVGEDRVEHDDRSIAPAANAEECADPGQPPGAPHVDQVAIEPRVRGEPVRPSHLV